MDKNVGAQDVVERTIEVGEHLRVVELEELGSETVNLRDKLAPKAGVVGGLDKKGNDRVSSESRVQGDEGTRDPAREPGIGNLLPGLVVRLELRELGKHDSCIERVGWGERVDHLQHRPGRLENSDFKGSMKHALHGILTDLFRLGDHHHGREKDPRRDRADLARRGLGVHEHRGGTEGIARQPHDAHEMASSLDDVALPQLRDEDLHAELLDACLVELVKVLDAPQGHLDVRAKSDSAGARERDDHYLESAWQGVFSPEIPAFMLV